MSYTKIFLFTFSVSIMLLSFTSCKDDGNGGGDSVLPSRVDTVFTKTISFDSKDGLEITADQYHSTYNNPVILLCHQAGYSRGEYKEIAPKLVALGYNCVAMDQRSGEKVNGVKNETANRAKLAAKGQDFNDAKQDIEAAVNWVANEYRGKVILWGSSYSAALALIIATENGNVGSVMAFSPGEYLENVNVGESISTLNKPAFLASSNSEKSQTKLLFDKIPSSNKVQFAPFGSGVHGAKALWSYQTDNGEYWIAVKDFLRK